MHSTGLNTRDLSCVAPVCPLLLPAVVQNYPDRGALRRHEAASLWTDKPRLELLIDDAYEQMCIAEGKPERYQMLKAYQAACADERDAKRLNKYFFEHLTDEVERLARDAHVDAKTRMAFAERELIKPNYIFWEQLAKNLDESREMLYNFQRSDNDDARRFKDMVFQVAKFHDSRCVFTQCPREPLKYPALTMRVGLPATQNENRERGVGAVRGLREVTDSALEPRLWATACCHAAIAGMLLLLLACCCCWHAAAAGMLLLPCCCWHAAAAILPLPCALSPEEVVGSKPPRAGESRFKTKTGKLERSTS